MPEDLPAQINIKKNKLNTGSAWLWLLDIEITGESTLRFVNNPENISYQGNIYNKCNFTMGGFDKMDSGRLSDVSLNITNADLVKYILPYVVDYDGLIGETIIRTPVNSDHLDIDMSAKAEEFIVTGCSAGEEWVAFVLGAPNPLNSRFPKSRYFGLHCRYLGHFKGAECGYAGAQTTCNGTPARCAELGNYTRFGGQPGLRSKTIRFA